MADAHAIVHYGVPRSVDAPWESASGGVGRDDETARLAAIGEAVERACSAMAPLRTRRRAEVSSWDRIDGEDFALYTPEQMSHSSFPHGGIVDADCPYVEVFSLDSGEPTWVPLPFVSLQDRGHTGVATSSGLAAGATATKALLGGIQELIERDALMVTWLHGLPGRAVEPPRSLMDEVADLGGEFTLFDLTPAYSPFPVAAVMGGIPKQGTWRYSLGVACKPNWQAATSKAYLEWAQGVLFAGVYATYVDVSHLTRDATLRSFDEHAMFYTLHPDLWSGLPILRGRDRVHAPSAVEAPSDVHAALETARSALAAAGIRVYYREITTIDALQAGLHVAKALSPDMALLYAHEAWPLLHKVDTMLGSRYPGREGETQFPNLRPHPLG